MKILLEISLSEESMAFLEDVAKETGLTVSQVAKKYSKDPFLLEMLGDYFGPLVRRVYKSKSKMKGGE